jgi:hypothetical protein
VDKTATMQQTMKRGAQTLARDARAACPVCPAVAHPAAVRPVAAVEARQLATAAPARNSIVAKAAPPASAGATLSKEKQSDLQDRCEGGFAVQVP